MKRANILFVDDEPNVTAALRRAFRQEPYDIMTAASAIEALEILSRHEIDVVISDERMPGMQGSVFLSQVRDAYPDTVRIILSGQASLEDVMRAINEGEIYRFFIKPFNAMDLCITVRQAMEHRQLVQLSRQLLQQYRRQANLMEKQGAYIEMLEKSNPGLTRLDTDSEGAIILCEDDADLDVQELLEEISQELEHPPKAP